MQRERARLDGSRYGWWYLGDASKAFLNAAVKGDVDAVNAALVADADVNARSGTALCSAANNGHVAIVSLLLEKGANVNVRGGLPLQVAATNGHIEAVRLLLAYGADANGRGAQARRLAAENGHTDIVDLLPSRTDSNAVSEWDSPDRPTNSNSPDTQYYSMAHFPSSATFVTEPRVPAAYYASIPPHFMSTLTIAPEDECPVCMTPLVGLAPHLSVRTSCFHIICTPCSVRLAQDNATCPLCRS